ARDELGRRLGLDAPFDCAQRALDHATEEAAGDVPHETAEGAAHAAEPARGAIGPESDRGAQHHDEQPHSLDEHRLPCGLGDPLPLLVSAARARCFAGARLRVGAVPADTRVTNVTREAAPGAPIASVSETGTDEMAARQVLDKTDLFGALP